MGEYSEAVGGISVIWAWTGTKGEPVVGAHPAPMSRESGPPITSSSWSGWRRRGWYIPASAAVRNCTRQTRPMLRTGIPSIPADAVRSPGRRRNKGARLRPPALRLRVPDEVLCFEDGHYGKMSQHLERECGDFILRRSDGVFAYQLAVVADDAAMGVTEVVRGRDLLSSTPRQLYLYRLLGFRPPAFLSYAAAARSRRPQAFQTGWGFKPGSAGRQGLTGKEIVGRLAWCAGLLDRPEPALPEELLPLFSWKKVPHSDICLPEGLF